MKQKHRLPFPGFFCDSLELMTRDVNTAICSFSDQLGFYTTFSRMLQRTGIWAWILSGFFFLDSFKILSRFFQDPLRRFFDDAERKQSQSQEMETGAGEGRKRKEEEGRGRKRKETEGKGRKRKEEEGNATAAT